ncbi:sugar phosphate nucleotidyltransferase [Rurimicrobium arvi]|uniref:Sugar phosphate nucleotidyltransferase n=1 Tax=Rurimicrobium arvi TaxID=2049916 RepID=A0ABP8ML10_9BACT
MKAIIPVAGAGTKLRPLTYTQPKALIPIAGKTILSVIVDQLLESGVNEFVFVIGYLGEKIQDYVASNYPNLKCSFVTQNDRKGIGHAIGLTRANIDMDEPVIIVLGDTICDYDLKKVLTSDVSLIGVQKVDDPRNFGVAELGPEDRVTRVVEKPLIPKSNMAMVGIYFIRETRIMFEALETVFSRPVAKSGEFPLTDALEEMIAHYKVRFDAFRINTWFDCGKKETLLSTNATLLKYAAQQRAEEQSDVVIIPPVSIAKGCKIRNSIIGPNVTIGEATKIEFSIIKNSIIGSYAELEDVLLHGSIIGNDAFVRGSSQSLNIGDNTEIDLR